MALLRPLFNRKPPDRLLEISERVYVFDCCFSTDVLDEDAYKQYMGEIVLQLHDYYPDGSFMVFNFKEGDMKSQISDILSPYDMTVMEYPRRYESCPLMPLEIIYHFLRSSESWLSLEGQQNVLLMHCERGGWPVLAFMLAGLLLYRKQYTGEQKTLEMMYKQAPKELNHLLSPLNPQPSQMRYLQYISRRNIDSEWPPPNTPLVIDCIIVKHPTRFRAGKGDKPVARVYGQDPVFMSSRSTKLLFSSSKRKKHNSKSHEKDPVKLNICCRVQGDVVLECVYLSDIKEEIMFRVMFHTAFIRSNTLLLSRDDVDILWDAKFSRGFKAEVRFLDADATSSTISSDGEREEENDAEAALHEEFYEVEEIFSNSVEGTEDGASDEEKKIVESEYDIHWSKITRVPPGSIWAELQRQASAPEIDVSEIETLFSAAVAKPAAKPGGPKKAPPKNETIHLIDLRRVNNTEIMLTKVKMPFPDMMAAVLALDEAVLDVDQVENLIKFCLTKEEMELLKNYSGDNTKLGKCEQFFMELMKVPRVEAKLRVFLFKINFNTQITEFKKSLNLIYSACNEVQNSSKFKEVMRIVLALGNTLNNGTARGGASGFKLDSLLKLNETRAASSRMTLMHYLAKLLVKKHPHLLDFYENFISLEASSKTLKTFISSAQKEVGDAMRLYSSVGKNADALVLYFGEDLACCPFEQVTQTLLTFVKTYRNAHLENLKEAELEKRKLLHHHYHHRDMVHHL